jgi:hypothetical protein
LPTSVSLTRSSSLGDRSPRPTTRRRSSSAAVWTRSVCWSVSPSFKSLASVITLKS